MGTTKIAFIATLLALGVSGTANAGDRTSDTWKEAQLVTTYTLNQHLNPFEIDVVVSGSKVMLTGEVESEVERALAEQLALGIKGIDQVDNQLALVPEVQRKVQSGEFSRAVGDASVIASIKSRMLWNRHTDGLDITVESNDGWVRLGGTVNSSLEAELARAIALNTDGVRGVTTSFDVGESASDDVAKKAGRTAQKAGELVKKAKSSVSDGWITTKVRAMIFTDKRFQSADVKVTTRNGAVTLTGSVPSVEKRADLIGSVHDVVGVDSVSAAAVTVRQRTAH